MRDIPGFGIWLALMTAMSGVIGCGPDKPAIGGPGGRPAGTDAGSGDGGTTSRPPPVQPSDGGAERPPLTTTPTPTGGTPGAMDGAATPGADAGADAGLRDLVADAPSARGGAGAAASGGLGGTGGAINGAGGMAGAPPPGTGGSPANTGGAPGTGGAGGARSPATGGMSGSGGSSGSGGAPGSGGTTPPTGGGGAAGGGGTSAGPAPAPGELAIVELLINPASTDTGREWIEVVNRTTHDLSLVGLHVADAANDAAVDFGAVPALLPAGTRAVLVQSADAAKNGGITAATATVVGTFGTLVSLNNEADTISLFHDGILLDKLTWDATLGTGYDGHALVIDDAGKRCPATTAFGDAGSFGTPGTAGAACP